MSPTRAEGEGTSAGLAWLAVGRTDTESSAEPCERAREKAVENRSEREGLRGFLTGRCSSDRERAAGLQSSVSCAGQPAGASICARKTGRLVLSNPRRTGHHRKLHLLADEQAYVLRRQTCCRRVCVSIPHRREKSWRTMCRSCLFTEWHRQSGHARSGVRGQATFLLAGG